MYRGICHGGKMRLALIASAPALATFGGRLNCGPPKHKNAEDNKKSKRRRVRPQTPFRRTLRARRKRAALSGYKAVMPPHPNDAPAIAKSLVPRARPAKRDLGILFLQQVKDALSM
jgi:hypothetical protein